MGYFPAAFVDLARDPAGEALQVKLHVRLNDGPGGSPGTLLTVTNGQEILQLSTIQRKRERSFGVIQGQAWQVQVTNIDLAMLAYSLPGCWACVEGGFPIAGEWIVFAQGKISSFSANTEGVVTLEVRDAIMDVLNFSLERDIRFQDAGWISEMKMVNKDGDSKSWDTGTLLTTSNAAALEDETFTVEFTSDVNFNVVLEDGSTATTGTTSADCTVTNLAGDSGAAVIPSLGWVQGAGNYSSGDTFEFFTARPRTAAELSPVNMVRHLIEDVAALESYDVLNGVAYSAPLYNSTTWDTLGAAAATHEIAGTFKKGARISGLIQDALKVVHGTVYPAPLGQVAIWTLQPATDGSLVLNGNPNSGPIDIISGGYTDTLADTITDVIFEYKVLGSGEEASYSTPPMDMADSPLLERRSKTVKIGWEVRGLSIQSAANQYLARNTSSKREHTLKTTLAGAVADLGGSVAIKEASTGLSSAVVATTDIIIDLLNNSAEVKAHNDPIVNQGFFRVGVSLIGGTDVIW